MDVRSNVSVLRSIERGENEKNIWNEETSPTDVFEVLPSRDLRYPRYPS